MRRKKLLLVLLSIVGFLFLIMIVRAFIGAGPIGDKVAVVDIIGVISESEPTIEHLHKYRDDPSVKAIVLRIDSPGGSVAPVQEIYSELRKLNKPLIASMGGTAASGGYYVACAANQILANPGTLAGSIGVIMQFLKMKGLYDKVGLDSQTVKSGKFKDMGSATRDLTDEERGLLQETIDDVHNQFIDAIYEGRKDHLTREEIASLADGRIFSGRQALEYKLVDRLGNLADAIELAAKQGGIDGRPKIARVKRTPTLLERILGIPVRGHLEGLLRHPGASFRYELRFGD